MIPDDFDVDLRISTFWCVAIVAGTLSVIGLAFFGLITLVKSG